MSRHLSTVALFSMITLTEARKSAGNMFGCNKPTGDVSISRDCDELLYLEEPESIIMIMIVVLSLLLCIIFPLSRCCGGCGSTKPTHVDDSFCCTGCSCTGCCGPDDIYIEGERKNQQSNFTRSKFSPLHPLWAKIIFPIAMILFTVLGIILSIAGLSKLNEEVSDSIDSAEQAVRESLDPVITDAQSIQDKYPSLVSYDAAGEIRSGKDSAIVEINKARDDVEKSKGIREAVIYAQSFIVLPLAIIVTVFACIKCSRNNGGCASPSHHLLLISSLSILVYIFIVGYGFAVADLLVDDVCYETKHLADSTTPRGLLRSEIETNVCPTDEVAKALRNLRSEQARAVAAGLPDDRQRELIAIIEPYEDCKIIIEKIAKITGDQCTELHSGVRTSTAGVLFLAIGIIFLLITLVVGYKRWIDVEQTHQTEMETDDEDADVEKPY